MYDIRDDKPYTVRKLADGNCWMTDNLNYAVARNTTLVGSYNNGTTFNFVLDGTYDWDGDSTAEYNGKWYYNWLAATAGVGDFNTPGERVIDGSICPAGWRIPTSSTNYGTPSFEGLLSAYNITNGASGTYDKLTSSPLSFTADGVYNNGSLMSGYDVYRAWSSATPSGFYNTSVSQGTTYQGKYIYFYQFGLRYDNAIYMNYYNYGRWSGYPVRCVANP